VEEIALQFYHKQQNGEFVPKWNDDECCCWSCDVFAAVCRTGSTNALNKSQIGIVISEVSEKGVKRIKDNISKN